MMTADKTKGKRQKVKGEKANATFYVLPFILILALALRLLLWSAPLHLPANDEVEYITVARDLLAGRGWHFYEHYHWLRAPLYPLFLAGSLWLAGGDLHRAALPNIALSVATVYLNYRLTLALTGRRTGALLAALLTAILWTFATFASLYMSETLFTLLFTGGLVCLALEQRTKNTKQEPAMSALAGVLFGLATLTRSITLLFLPIVALWLLTRSFHHKDTNDTNIPTYNRTFVPSVSLWLSPIVFLLAAALTIAPWTIRNYLAYGRPILVETGLSYNLWAFNEPRESAKTIFHTLENIANPADRSDYATAKGLARLREDPMILLRKLWPNWVYLWRVKPIEDRFIQENYYGDVGLPLFASALLFDDLLYFVIALAGIAGLMLYRQKSGVRSEESGARRRRTIIRNLQSEICNPKWLLTAWLLYVIGTLLLTHGEARYRHFLFPALIPFAAWALVRIANCKLHIANWRMNLQFTIYNLRSAIRSPVLVIGALWALFAGTFLAYYPWEWAGQNLARGWYAAQAEFAWARGDQAGALQADQHALAAQETPDGWLRLAEHANGAGDPRRARDAYNAARTLIRNYLPGVARFGDFLRARGDEARARQVFGTDDVDPQRLLDWSWRELRPAPRARLEIGDGLDWGYIRGMYPAEAIQDAQARWTNGAAQIRFGAALASDNGAATQAIVQLRLAAPRPGGAPVAAQVCAGDQCWKLQLTAAWRIYRLAFDTAGGAPPTIELRSETFEAAGDRPLGVLVDSAELIRTGEEQARSPK